MPLIEKDTGKGCCYCLSSDRETKCPKIGPEHHTVLCCLCSEWACMCEVDHTVTEWLNGEDDSL